MLTGLNRQLNRLHAAPYSKASRISRILYDGFSGLWTFCSLCNITFSYFFCLGCSTNRTNCSQKRDGNICCNVTIRDHPSWLQYMSSVLSGRYAVILSSPEYSKEICYLWFIAKNRHSWPQKRFCGFVFHFLLDSLFQVTARRECLSGEGNRAKAGEATTWGSFAAFWFLPQYSTDTLLKGDRNKLQVLEVAWQSCAWECSKEKQLLTLVWFLLGCGLHLTRQPRLQVARISDVGAA